MGTADIVVNSPSAWAPDANDLAGVVTGPNYDLRVRRPYTEREMAEVRSSRSLRYPGEDPEHHHGVPGARGMWGAAERPGTIAAVLGNPSLVPAAGNMIVDSCMATIATIR